MSRTTRALLMALASMLAIAAIGGIASAGRLRVDERDFEVSWPETARLTLRYSGREVSCPLTITGFFENEVIRKTDGSRIAVTRELRQRPERCVGGARWTLSEPVREVLYEGFEGTLPNITAIRVAIPNMSIRVTEFIECTYEMPATDPLTATLTIAGGVFTTFTVTGNYISERPFSCTTARFSGGGTITRLGSANRIAITLI